VDTQRLLDMVTVNCSAVVHLTRLYLPEMLQRRRGDVLIVASDRFVSSRAVHFHVRRHQGLRSSICRGACGRSESRSAFASARCALGPRRQSFRKLPGRRAWLTP